MKHIVGKTLAHWKAANAPRMGAALSYYAMLSFVPLILLIVSAVTMLFSKDVVEDALMHQLVTTIGDNAALYISEILHNAPLQDISVGAAILSGVTFIVGALGVFSELDRDLDELWAIPAKAVKRHTTFLKKVGGFIHEKIMILSIIPLLAILLMVSILITFFLSIVQSTIAVLPPFELLIPVLQILVPLLLSTLLFSVIYRVLPNRKLPWKVLFAGGLVTSLLFIFGNFLIATYIKLLIHTSVFGGASSLVGLLVWIYYSAQVFFLGASFTYIYAKEKKLIPSRE